MEKDKAISRRQFLTGLGVTAGAIGLSTLSSCSSSKAKSAISLSHGNDIDLFPIYENGHYVAKDFSYLADNVELGLTAENINHHIGLYKKYVDKVNKSEKMMAENKVDDFALKNLAFSLNGMALHDIYFANMSTEASKRSNALTNAIEGTFGNFDTYYSNLVETAMKVKGWSLTGINLLNGKIYNYAEDTHSSNYPAYFMPILALDVYDHAWVKQFGEGMKAKKMYIDSFTKVINWDLVSRRFDAISMSLR
jgi:Fe-Mn family superoxide dismutase